METRILDYGMESQCSLRCGMQCLGLLTFHHHIKGDKIHLSHGGLLAQRKDDTSMNGLLLSSRHIRLQERIRLQVVKHSSRWTGALRLGFTNVPPRTRHLPLPLSAIPDLTNSQGHWVAAVHESFCRAGSELEFWVSHGGNVYVSIGNYCHKLLSGLDLSRPLWAVIDLYGNTQAVLLLGSKKKGSLFTRRACPVPARIILPAVDHSDNLIDGLCSDDCISYVGSEDSQESEQNCVICMVEPASTTLPCGHCCLCSHCVSKFLQEFNKCPLCRHEIQLGQTDRGMKGVKELR